MRTILTLAISLVLVAASNSLAGSAAWKRTPGDGDWNNPANWLGDGPPNGASDIATFNFSRLTDLFLSAPTTLDSLVVGHQAGNADWTTTVPSGMQLSFVGAGINNLYSFQYFVTDATGGPGGGIIFSNSASSGSFTTFTNRGGTASGESGGFVEFLDRSSEPLGYASTIINEGGTVAGAGGGFTELRDTADLGSTDFGNLAGVAGASGGSTSFYDSATGGIDMFAGGGTEVGAGPGSIHFFGSSSGGVTLTANGGTNGAAGGLIEIRDDCPGGFRLFSLNGNGVVDLSNHNPAIPVTVGAIEGEGSILLGGNNLAIGPPDIPWHYFSGVISDGGKGGSLTLVAGDQILALVISGASTYTGGTTVNGGYLYVLKNTNGSGTGRGPVTVPSGLLGGTGVIGGAVTIGDGNGAPGYLEPGSDVGHIGVLTVQKKVTFKSDGTYTFQISSKMGKAAKLNAKGVSIETGATINAFDRSTQVSRPGTRYFAISNTSPSPIAGTFSNLPDGGTIQIGNNSYQANYEGGTGNDLTLTVVP